MLIAKPLPNRLEWKDGQWQKSRAGLEDPNNPCFSLLCNILYSEEPDWLLKVKENGMAVVNAKDSDERAQVEFSLFLYIAIFFKTMRFICQSGTVPFSLNVIFTLR